MTRTRSFPTLSIILLLFCAVLGFAPAFLLQAQDDQNNNSSSGFSLRQPRVFFGGHIGFNIPSANSDLFDMVTSQLTLKKSDFRAATFGGDFGIPFRSHFAAVLSFEYSRSTTPSESRDFVENNGDPIAQTTRLTQVPITATLRYYPRKTGETVGSYAWIPTRFNPYIGAGAGILHYSLFQSGRFVDTRNLSIFDDTLQSDGFTDTEHLAGGMDISITPHIFLNAEARYSWASANLSNDFTGFKPIDLSGFRLLGGMYFRF